MAAILNRQRADGRRYYQVVWRETPNGPKTSKNFDLKRDAERYRVELDHKLLVGSYSAPALGKVTLADYWADFVTRRFWADGTRALYEDSAARVLPLVGGRQLATLRPVDIERTLVVLADTYSPGTIRTTWGHLGAVLRAAHDEGRLPRVPSPALPKVAAKVNAPTPEEVDALYEAAMPRMQVAIELAARAGLRRSEALGLTVDRIDRERGTIHVDRQAEPKLGAAEPFRWAPRLKSSNSYRLVPITAETVERLPAESNAEHGLVLGTNGRSWAGTVFGSAWTKLARRVGLEYTFHDLRHFFCSTLLAEGINPKAVARAAGVDVATLFQTYAHVMPDDDDRIRLALRRERPAVISLVS